MQVVIVSSIKIHALTTNASNIHTINRTELKFAQSFTIHCTIGNHNATAYHLLWLVFFVPIYFNFWTNESYNGRGISFSTYHENFIAHMEVCFL